VIDQEVIVILRIRMFLCFGLLVLTVPFGFSLDDKGLASNLEVSQPAEETFGIVFSITNNNLGNSFWVDPVTNELTSYSQVGLGGKYYVTNDMRIGATTEFFFNSWTYANKDTQSLYGGALKAQVGAHRPVGGTRGRIGVCPGELPLELQRGHHERHGSDLQFWGRAGRRVLRPFAVFPGGFLSHFVPPRFHHHHEPERLGGAYGVERLRLGKHHP